MGAALAYSFKVEICTAEGSTDFVGAFGAFSGIRLSADVVRSRGGSRAGGVSPPHIGLAKFDNVTLSGGIISAQSAIDWLNAAMAFKFDADINKVAAASRNVIVTAMDSTGKETARWTLINAVPVSYRLGEFNAKKSAVAAETLELAIEGFERQLL